MVETNITPTESTNQPKEPEQRIDNMGNPVDEKGNLVEKDTNQEENKADGDDTNIESLQKALKDTKAELTRLQQKGTDTETEDLSESKADDLEIKTKEAEDKGVDLSVYSEEYNSKGELSEDSYKELAGKGFNKEIVDDYIAGQKARLQQQTEEVTSVVGGEKNLDAVLEWAAGNLSAEEIAAYNEATKQGTASAKIALRGIYSSYIEANGQSPNLQSGDTIPSKGDVFKSPFDMQKAQQDPRYWKDPDFQKEVQEKIQRSMAAGTI